MKHTLLAFCLAASAGLAWAGEEPPDPPFEGERILGTVVTDPGPRAGEPGEAEISFQGAPVPPADTAPRAVPLKDGWHRNRNSKDGSPLSQARVLSISDGAARVLLAGREQVLRPGDAVGLDTVKSVTPGRVVFERSAGPGSAGGVVVLSVDAGGRTRFRVYLAKEGVSRSGTGLN